MKSRTIALILAVSIQTSLCGFSAAADAGLTKGVDLYKQGKYTQAAGALRAVVTSNPKNSSAYYYLGCCYYQLGQPQDAANIYQLITRQFPQSAEAGLARQMLGQLSGGGTASVNATSAVRTSAPAHAYQHPTAEQADDMAKLPNDVKVYFKRGSNGHMESDAFVNGKPLKVWFDTGAGAHFGLNHLQGLGVLKPNRPPDSTTSGWAGNKVPIWVMELPVRMGNLQRTITCTVEEEMPMMPLVGQEFIQGYTYEIDDKGGCMHLKKQGTEIASQAVDPLYDVSCVKRNGDDWIPLEINGKQVQAFIDTGASSTIISYDTMRQLGIEIPDDAPVRTASGVGGNVQMRLMDMDLKVGPIRRQGFKCSIGGNCGNCIGQDFMEGWRFTVDRQKNLMRFFH